MADALPTHRLYFILVSWSKKVQKNKFTHFFKMADACLHIYFVLYSFWEKKNEKNKKMADAALHILCFLYSFLKKKNANSMKFWKFEKMADAALHILCFLHTFHGPKKCKKLKKMKKSVKNGWRCPTHFMFFILVFQIKNLHILHIFKNLIFLNLHILQKYIFLNLHILHILQKYIFLNLHILKKKKIKIKRFKL